MVKDIARSLERQTGDKVSPTNEAIFECFRKHCYNPGYEPHIWDDRYISTFENTQDYLIEIGMINPNECMRT